MTKPRDDTAPTSADLTNDQKAVLAFLGQDAGGYTAGNIAKACGYVSRSEMAIFRKTVLLPMVDAGWLNFMDNEAPALFEMTAAGRAKGA